jgi:hypothetical protein
MNRMKKFGGITVDGRTKINFKIAELISISINIGVIWFSVFCKELHLTIKLSHYRPEQAHRFPGSLGTHISWHRHMKVVDCQPYAPAAFTPRINLVLIFRGWVDPRTHGTVRCHGKNPGDTGNRSRDLPTCSAAMWLATEWFVAV